jgi:maltose phosphorylase
MLVTNEDTNWEEKFWEPLEVKKKQWSNATNIQNSFQVTTFMQNSILDNEQYSPGATPQQIKSNLVTMF